MTYGLLRLRTMNSPNRFSTCLSGTCNLLACEVGAFSLASRSRSAIHSCWWWRKLLSRIKQLCRMIDCFVLAGVKIFSYLEARAAHADGWWLLYPFRASLLGLPHPPVFFPRTTDARITYSRHLRAPQRSFHAKFPLCSFIQAQFIFINFIYVTTDARLSLFARDSRFSPFPSLSPELRGTFPSLSAYCPFRVAGSNKTLETALHGSLRVFSFLTTQQ